MGWQLYTCEDVYTALVTKSTYEKTFKNIQLFSQSEPVFVNLLRSTGIVSQPGGSDS
jgi:hypothetical protein